MGVGVQGFYYWLKYYQASGADMTVVTGSRDSVHSKTSAMLVILLKYAGSFCVAILASILGNLVTEEIERCR